MFQQNDAASHYGREVHSYLNAVFLTSRLTEKEGLSGYDRQI